MKKEFPRMYKMASKWDNVPGKDKKFRGFFTLDDLNCILENHQNIDSMRGQIISSSLAIETKVNEIIASTLFGKDKDKKRMFLELFLNKEFFTLMQKWKILRDLFKINKINSIPEKSQKLLLKNIHEIIEIRNNFAHGQIIFFGKKPYLEYLREGNNVRIGLNKTYLGNLRNLFHKTFETLEGI